MHHFGRSTESNHCPFYMFGIMTTIQETHMKEQLEENSYHEHRVTRSPADTKWTNEISHIVVYPTMDTM